MIGQHTVTYVADPSGMAWGSPINPNPDFTTNGAGWWTGNANQTWTWVTGGWWRGTTTPTITTNTARLIQGFAEPSGVGLYRVTARATVPAGLSSLVLSLWFGQTAATGQQRLLASVDTKGVAGTYTVELIADPTLINPAYRGFLFPELTTTRVLPGVVNTDVDYIRVQTGHSEDLSCLVDSISIHYGRDDSDSQPDANTATLDISTNTHEEDWPADFDVGGTLRVTTTVGGSSFTRFVGKVTDMSLGWDDAGTETPDHSVGQVIATGPLADLGRRVVGDQPWTQELDGARVSRILAAAGVTLNPATSDPGTVQILARDVDAQPALDLAQAVAGDAGGILWSTRDGDIRYADANHRRGSLAALMLNACDVLVTPTWRRTTEGLVNEVSIGYGPTPQGGEQPRFTDKRQDSIDKWGHFGISATTQLAALADAQAMGSLLLTRNHDPVWILAALPVDMGGLDLTETQALLGMDMHALLSVVAMPAAATVPTQATLWVEGWTETLAWGVHDIELVVSGYCRTSPPPAWDDTDPSLTWNTATGSWDDAQCFGPQPSLGRWNDVPATQRWNTDQTVTWDTWVG